jgi:hypothetical protein
VEEIVNARLDKEVKPLKDKLDWSDRQALTKRAQSLEGDINGLEDELGYPGSLVETHRQAMLSLGLREPDLSAEDLLVRVAGFSTVKQAMLKSQANGKDEDAPAQKPAASVMRKPAPTEMPRGKGGAISITRALDLLMKPKR